MEIRSIVRSIINKFRTLLKKFTLNNRLIEKSLYCKYKSKFNEKLSKKLKKIEEMEKDINNVKFDYDNYPDTTTECALKFKYFPEIYRYFQINDDSLGYDIYIIKYLLCDILIYIYITKYEKLSEEKINICANEIEIRFYLFLNCIYNFKEKFEKFFEYKNLRDSILTDTGTRAILNLFNKTYPVIKDYCLGRKHLVHDIYSLRYNKSKNEINIICSNFDLSINNLINDKDKLVLSLDEKILINLVEELQILRKKTIEILYDVEKNINLEKLKNKFKQGKGFIITG